MVGPSIPFSLVALNPLTLKWDHMHNDSIHFANISNQNLDPLIGEPGLGAFSFKFIAINSLLKFKPLKINVRLFFFLLVINLRNNVLEFMIFTWDKNFSMQFDSPSQKKSKSKKACESNKDRISTTYPDDLARNRLK